jgi:hypothetical protein
MLGAVMAARPMFINMRPQWACESCSSRDRYDGRADELFSTPQALC